MKNNVFLFLILCSCLSVFSQSESILIYGKVLTDSLSPENIHVINKSTNKGAITNAYGDFQILVNLNDTLLISSIQFETKEIIISAKELKNQNLFISLHLRVNELDEITLKQHDLSGFFQSDVENASLKNHVDEFTLNLPNAGKAPVTDVDHIRLRYGQYSGIVGALYGWISGEKKKLKKLEKLTSEKMTLDKIRNLITDSYFIESLKIKKEDINAFISYCKPRGILTLYKENKKLEIIEILIEESKKFIRK